MPVFLEENVMRRTKEEMTNPPRVSIGSLFYEKLRGLFESLDLSGPKILTVHAPQFSLTSICQWEIPRGVTFDAYKYNFTMVTMKSLLVLYDC